MANSNGWGDGAANNAIGWGQGANNAIGWGSSHATSWAGATDIVGLTTDPASSAFFSATGLTGATQQSAIDTLVKGLKADGLWSKMKAIYPFVTDNRNLLSYTEDFSNAFWTKASATVTANTTTAPNGTLTADTIQNIGSGYVAISNIVQATNTYTQSVYFKKNNNNWVGMYTSDQGSNYAVAWFNVNTGVTGTVAISGNFTSATSAISNVGNGWYRCSLTFTKPTTANSDTAFMIPDADNTFARTIGQNTFMWGAQLEISTLTTYQPIATTQQAYIAAQFKYNLVNPVDSDAAFRLVFNGGWTHSSTGATPNGTNGYADTKIVPSSVLSQNNSHISHYSRTNSQSIKPSIHSYSTLRGEFAIYPYYTGNVAYSAISGDTGASITSSTNSLNYYIANRTTSTSDSLFTGLTKATRTVNSILPSTSPIFIAAQSANGTATVGFFDVRQCAFATIGDGLTDTEASNLYTRVQAFQTSLSRNI